MSRILPRGNGAFISYFRKRYGLSSEQLAQILGVELKWVYAAQSAKGPNDPHIDLVILAVWMLDRNPNDMALLLQEHGLRPRWKAGSTGLVRASTTSSRSLRFDTSNPPERWEDLDDDVRERILDMLDESSELYHQRADITDGPHAFLEYRGIGVGLSLAADVLKHQADVSVSDDFG